MHGEEFIADNMIKVGYAVISVDWRSAIVRDIAKRRNHFFFWTKSAYKNKFSGHMHNSFLL